MKQKVLLALIALFSFVGAWAYDDPDGCVYEDQYYHYCLNPKSVRVGDEVPVVTVIEQGTFEQVDDEDVEVLGVYTFANGVLTPVNTSNGVPAVNNYYIKVVVDDGVNETTAFVPFKAYDIVDPEIVWNEDSYVLSLAGDVYKNYLKTYPKSYVWDGEKCWYEDASHAAWEDVYDAENGQLKEGYSYDWKAIYKDYPENQLLENFPTFGYANNGDVKVLAQYGIEDGPNFIGFEGVSKVVDKEGFVVASWNEDKFIQELFYENYSVEIPLVRPQGQNKINLDNGNVFQLGSTSNYAMTLEEVYAPDTYQQVCRLKIQITPADEFADPDELDAAANALTYVGWTMAAPTTVTYNGYDREPNITVFATNVDGEELEFDPFDDDEDCEAVVKYFTDEELTKEVPELKHVGTYYVQVFVPGLVEAEAEEIDPAQEQEPGANPNEDVEPEMVEGLVPLGSSKMFTIKKKSYFVIDLAQVHMQYGDNEATIEPLYSLSGNVGDDEIDDFIVEGLGYVKRGPNYVGVDLVAGAVIQYTTTGIPHAYTGRTYKADGSVDFKGYEDYEIRVLTNNAQLIADPGVMTIEFMEDAQYKIYGEKDPDFNAVYQNTDEDADYYIDDEDEVGKPVYYRAYNQTGEEINYTKDPVIIEREKAATYDEDGKLLTAEGEDVDEYDFYVTTTTNYILSNVGEEGEEVTEYDAEHLKLDASHPDVVTNYKWTLEDEFEIIPFDISTDIPVAAVEDDPDTDEDESVEGYEEKFVITVDGVTYNADTQFPDAEITFNHEVLGLINLTYNVDAETGEKTPIVPFVKKWHEDGDVSNSGVYETENYAYNKGNRNYNYGGDFVGSYTGDLKKVKRNADAAVIEGSTIWVTGLNNFVNEKSQTYAIQPKKLSVKVKGNADMAFAGATPNFGIELDQDGEYGWPDKEVEADQTAVLTGLGRAITEFDPDGEYGYTYDGGIGIYDGAEEEGHKAKIGVKDAAKTAKNVVLAASNYEPIYAEDAVTVNPIDLVFKPSTQTIAYPEAVEAVYSRPQIISDILLSRPAVKFTQEEIDAAQEGDEAYEKTTDDVKVPAVVGTIELVGDLPEGFDYDALEDLIEPLYAQVNQNKVYKTCLKDKDTDEWVPNAEALSIDREKQIDPETGEPTEEDVVNPTGYNISEQPGDLIITPLLTLRLSYDNIEDALEDHKGQTVQVYLPHRRLKTDQWYSMVLPFRFYVPTLSNKLNYASVALLDQTNNDANVHFNTSVGYVAANEPFLLKAAPAEPEGDAPVAGNAKTADQLAEVSFGQVVVDDNGTPEDDSDDVQVVEGGVVIADNCTYNGENGEEDPWPFVQDAANHKFIGTYKTVEYLEAANSWIGKKGVDETEWYLSTTNGNFYVGNEANKNHNILTTEAYVKYPDPESSANARFFVDEDGVTTAITGIGEDVETSAAPANGFAEGWYTINGIKLEGEPTTTGTYIYNGKKVFIQK